MPARCGKHMFLAAAVSASMAVSGAPAIALDRLDFQVRGGDEALTRTVNSASLLRSLQSQNLTEPQDLVAAARADYGRLLAALYARGHYSVIVRIAIDGREAADIRPLDVPTAISVITVTVDPGPAFALGQTRIAPQAAETDLPKAFRTGEPAESAAVTDAVAASIRAWRNVGNAKAAVADQSVIADHNTARLDVDVALDPGPKLRFGALGVDGEQRMREARIVKIAGLPSGKTFSETELRRAETRLRRTGIFSSVTLEEDTAITAPDLLGITASVVEQKPRRYSLGAELSSIDGLSLTGSWLHRNLWGGGERLEFKAGVTNIGSSISGVDYGFGITLDRPATLTPDTTAGLVFRFAHADEVDYALDAVDFGLAFSQVFSERLTARAELTYSYVSGSDPQGDFTYEAIALPVGVTWDRRDVPVNATRGFYLDAEVKPFLGLGDTESGVRTTVDGRVYRSLDGEGRFVVAARLQGGAIYGPDLLDVPRDQLFYSGGGGTVRGQPYRSLGVLVPTGTGTDFLVGGRFFVAGSLELRAKFSDKIGVVGFVDAGSVGIDGMLDDSSTSHAGAGLGVRYDTAIGPIRLDIAAPVSGETGDGVQFYIGLGQAF
jgi:translocation and assembly module TamA